MAFEDFYRLVYGHLGHIATSNRINSADESVNCLLFETFELECGLDDRYGSLGAAVLIGRSQATGTFLGERISMNSDPASIRASLDQIVEWCRLHLTDTFLERYDAAHAGSSRAIGSSTPHHDPVRKPGGGGIRRWLPSRSRRGSKKR